MACLQSANRSVCYCVAFYENFAVNQKASIFVSYVIKEFAQVFSCACIELWMHLGSLESTQEEEAQEEETQEEEARAKLTHLSCSPNFPRAPITQYTHAKHES